jgi:tRNA1Val (adenine37-N6)-methyltransferase
MNLNPGEELCHLRDGFSVIQSKEYFCFTTDSVLLADFCRAKKGDRCVDLGAGQGILSILLFARYHVGSVDAVEIQPQLCEILKRNATLNDLDTLHVHECDLREHRLKKGSYDIVICNPPYAPSGTGKQSDVRTVGVARHEIQCSLSDVIVAGMELLRFGGSMCMCLRPQRLCDAIVQARQFGGEVKKIRFVHSYIHSEPGLVLLQIRRGGKPGLDVASPLVLYESQGVESRELKRIYQGDSHER